MSTDHVIHFLGGRAMMNRLVSISQPMKVMILFIVPSAVIFLTKAELGCSIGSKIPAKGQKTMKSAMLTFLDALATIPQLLLVSSTAHEPSSMWPSVPPLTMGSSLTLASSDLPNSISLLNFTRSGRAIAYGDGRVVGSH